MKKNKIYILIALVIIMVMIAMQGKKQVALVNFRTSSLTYSTYGAVAFNSACGDELLTQYGQDASSGNSAGICSDPMSYLWCDGDCTIILTNLPGGWKTGGNKPSLYRLDISSPNYNNKLIICDDDGNQKTIKRYDLASKYISNVSNSPNSIDSSMEVICSACAPESNSAFCSRLGQNCGDVTANDNCGQVRTVNCGTCSTGYTCSNGGCVQLGGNYQETADFIDVSTNEFKVEYNKPAYATGAVWQVAHGNTATYNITIPPVCWNAYANKISMKMVSSKWTSSNYCYNGAGWTSIGQSISTLDTIAGERGDYPDALYDGKWSGPYSASVWWDTMWMGFQQQGNWRGGTIVEEAIWWNIQSLPCAPESNSAFCSRLGKTCGDVTANDNCGTSRTVNCGTCSIGYTCSNGVCLSCTPNWQCTSWSTCSASCTQTRTCTDSNNCGTTAGKPSESQSCTGGNCPSACPADICDDNIITYDELILGLNNWVGN